MNNPLLEDRRLPAFERIEPQHVEPAIDFLLAENRKLVAALLADAGARSWATLIEPLEVMDERLARAWSPVAHLNAVRNDPALRKAYNACLGKLTDYHSEIGQNEALFNAFEEVAQKEDNLDAAQRKLLEHSLRDFRLSGVALSDADKKQYRELARRRSSLQAKFEENLLDASNAWSKQIEDERLLAGVTERAKQRAQEAAAEKGKKGWLLGLDYPSYDAVMSYADKASLRKEFYEAWVTRASDNGPHDHKYDNSEILEEILSNRQQMAKLLGFDHYAALSLQPKMARAPADVTKFLNELVAQARSAGQQEFEALSQYAIEHHEHEKLEAWDVAYFSEKLKRERFGISDEQLRPYFPLPVVLDGMFKIAGKLYGVEVRRRDDVRGYHEDVAFYDVVSTESKLRGSFFTDLFARDHKRGGAWMDECANRKRMGDEQQDPAAYLVCNFMPPVGDAPALLTHHEVLTLFHEFGHTLHHLLTRAEYPSVAGINNVPWDAVELPSQFMENFAYEHEALPLISRHHESGEPLPDDMLEKLRGARTFQSALHMLRQIEFSLFDFRLHMEFDPATRGTGQVQKILDEVRAQVAVVPVPAFNRFPNGFSHIFAGGYAAGYYSYKWAEVLSSDAFAAFEEEGIFDAATGRRFLQSILEVGGTQDAMDAFVAFRGREPSIEPLLRHAGIANDKDSLPAAS